ncbi:MAG: CoB--CoM heterodisulfide reductase subunit C [Methanobacterium sp.]|nr:CoB--CoM heterodisulfide reductase subunit C [Methanobacterium sp.]
MKQLKRLKNMLGGGNDTEEQKGTEEQQSETEMKDEGTETTEEEKLETAEKTEPEAKAEEPVKDKSAKEEKKEIKEKAKAKTEPEKKTKKSEKKPEVEEKPKTKRSDSMTLLEGREEDTLTRDSIDENFKQEIMDAGAETLALCFQCGTCTGACPSGRRTPYRIRQIVRKSVMGFKEEVISDDTLWMCTTCYECQERCPRGIKIVDIVKIARNYAAKAGYMAPAHKAVGSFVLKTGHGVPINDATMALRKKVGLDELPPTTHSFPGALDEVQKIIKATGFDDLIGYNWEKGELE